MDGVTTARISPWQGLALCVMAGALGIGLLTFKHFLPLLYLKMVAAGVVAAVVALGILAAPRIGLYVAVFYIYAGLSFYFGSYVAPPLVLLTLVAVLVYVVRGDRIRLRNATFLWSTGLFSILALQSMIFSHNLWTSFLGYSQFLKALVVVFLIVQIVRSPRALEQFAIVVFIGCIATVGLGVLNIIMGWKTELSVLPGAVFRFSGTHANANSSAVYMISGIPIGAYLIMRYRSLPVRLLAGLGTVSLAAATFFTFSRSAIVPLVFVIMATMVREARSKKFYAGFFVLVVAALLVTPSYYWERLRSIQDLTSGLTSDWSMLMRITALRVAWETFLDHPFTGLGLYNFAMRSGGDLVRRMLVHNSYLEILVGVGLLGFAAYTVTLASAIREYGRALKARWSVEVGWMRSLSYYLLISYLSALLGATFLSVPFYYVIWVPLGCGIAAGNISRGAAQREES